MPSVNMCIRIDSNLKKQAEDVLSQLGMTMSGTINMFLTQIVREKAVPLNLSLSPQDRTALDDILAAREERRNGFKVRMDVSIVGTKGEVMVIDGSEGTLMNVDYHYGLPAAVKVGDDVEVIQGDRGYNKEFDAVASEIREGLAESRFIPMRSTLDCMRILDECRRQMNLVYPFER